MPVLPAGACLVAEAAERSGHRVSVLDLMFEADPIRAVQDRLINTFYDVIGLSVRNIDNNDMWETCFYIQDLLPVVAVIRKHSDAPLVLGGAALMVMPEEILRTTGAECAVIGDGEDVFCRVLERIEQGRALDDLPGVASLNGNDYRAYAPVPAAYSRCQVPDYSRWIDLRAYCSRMSTAPLQTKLGCQFRCVYCTYRKIEGGTYRIADSESVAEAVVRLASSGLRDIEFVDNIFNAPYDHALAVCDSLIRAGADASFQSLELNPVGFSSELLTAMERAGFSGIGLTVESAADPVLQGLGKSFSARQVHQAAELVRSHRLPCVWIFLLGGPGETGDTVKETIRFAEQNIGPRDAAFFNIGIRIYPGTDLESIARQQGVLTRPAGEMLEPVFYVSPDVDALLIRAQVRACLNSHMNFMSVDTFSFPYLPLVNSVAYRLGLRPPLWRYTSRIRKGLRRLGMKV